MFQGRGATLAGYTQMSRGRQVFHLLACDGSLSNGIKWTILENLSTTVRIVVLPYYSGWAVTNSIAICDQGQLGVGSGCNNSAGDLLEPLFLAHTGQAGTYSVVSWIMEIREKHCWKRNKVLLTPGWQQNGDAWAQWITADQNWGGTYSRSSGQEGGTDRPWPAWCFPSISHCTTPRKCDWGRMLTGSSVDGATQKIRKRASGLSFLLPG